MSRFDISVEHAHFLCAPVEISIDARDLPGDFRARIEIPDRPREFFSSDTAAIFRS